MANQPPPPPSIRPWFRFGSLARPQAPQPAPSSPPQQPRRPPPVIRTPFGQTLRPAATVQPTSTVQPAQLPSATLYRPPSIATTQGSPQPPAANAFRRPPSLLTTQQAPPPSAARPPTTTKPSSPPTDASPTTQPTPPPTVPAAPTPTTFGTIPRMSPATTLLPPSSPSQWRSPQVLSTRKLPELSPPKPSTGASASPSTRSKNSPSADPRSPSTHVNYPSLSQIAPPRSPPTFSPPSPFRLPPQLMSSDEVPTIPSEEEPKRVLVQETAVGKPKLPVPSEGSNTLNKTTADGGFNGNHHGKSRSAGGDRNQKSRNHFGRATIITLAGDNKGAIMQVGVRTEKVGSQRVQSVSARTNRDHLQNHHNYETNSNVQGINNSIVFNSSFILHNPGVHFSHSRRSHHKGDKGVGFHYTKGAKNQR